MNRRPETGPMKFGDDWTGVFIRGDNAGSAAFMLRRPLKLAETARLVSPLEVAPLHGLADDLADSNEFGEREGLQRMRAFAECVAPGGHVDV
jgi:hypothetical protein